MSDWTEGQRKREEEGAWSWVRITRVRIRLDMAESFFPLFSPTEILAEVT